MKKRILLIISSFILLTSCSKGPEKVVEKIIGNLKKGKIVEAKKLQTEKTTIGPDDFLERVWVYSACL